jgi:hypothetical protein
MTMCERVGCPMEIYLKRRDVNNAPGICGLCKLFVVLTPSGVQVEPPRSDNENEPLHKDDEDTKG